MKDMVFCRDGVLRIKEWLYDSSKKEGKYVQLPLYITQQLDTFKFLKYLGSYVVFEEGLTVKEFFLNLKPWKDIMEGIACMDFDAFIQEVERPAGTLIENISHIEICSFVTFNPVAKFENDLADLFEKEENGKYYTLKPSIPSITNKVEMEVTWGYTAKLIVPEGDVGYEYDSVSLDYTPINEWAHIPMKISSTVFTERTANSDYMDNKESIFNVNHPLLTTSNNCNTVSLEADYPTFYNSIVKGFLWEIGFHYSPISRNKFAADIKDGMDEIETDLGNKDFPNIPSSEEDDTNEEPSKEEIYIKEQIELVNQIDPNLIKFN